MRRTPLSSGMSLTFQVEGSSDLTRSESGRLHSIRSSVANEISDHKPLTTAYACGEVFQLLIEGQQFPQGTPVSSASKTDHHDMTSDVESGVQSQSIKSMNKNDVIFMKFDENIDVHLILRTCIYKIYIQIYFILPAYRVKICPCLILLL